MGGYDLFYFYLMNRLILLLFLILTLPSMAQRRTAKELKSLAASQLSKSVMYTRGATQPEVLQLDDADNYAIYGTSHSFVVLSKSKNVRPILGVSYTPYKKGQMPCGFNWWLEAVGDVLASPVVYAPTRASYTAVDTMLTSKWGQGEPYNNYTPRVNGTHAPTGCMATAMAQILRYFKYPAQGQGTGTYTYGKRSRSSVISTSYNWGNMTDTYDDRSSTQRKTAVAYLMRDCGYACAMNYDTDGSGAYDNYAALALGRNFSYDSLAIKDYMRLFYSDTQWMQMIQSELLSHRPILYCAFDSNAGGHAFIFDGMDSKGLVHVNWGWDGSANGYYDIDLLNPSGYNFTQSQRMIVGLKPSDKPETGESYSTMWASTEQLSLKTNGSNILYMAVDNIYNMDYRPFEGQVGFYFVNTATNDTIANMLLDTKEDSISAVNYGSGFNLTNDSTGLAEVFPIDITTLPNGSYRAFLGSQAYIEHLATPFIYPNGEDYSFAFQKNADGTISGLDIATDIPQITNRTMTTNLSGEYFTLQGIKAGSSLESLPAGIYIRGGKKYVKD